MEDFQTYSPEEIIFSNLDELFQRALHQNEQELAHLRELAAEIASGSSDNLSFIASLPDHRLPRPEERAQISDQIASVSPALCAQTLTRWKILLCMELGKRIPSPETFCQDVFPVGKELSEFSLNRISYQKNNYTEKAFQRFSELLDEAKAAYAHSFPSVCEDVYNGISEYCILPIENSAEGRLVSFTRLISQFDLKIVATCDVRSGEDKTTRFALLRRGFSRWQSLEAYPTYFEISGTLSDPPSPEDLFTAARLCGLTLESADVKFSEPSREHSFHAVFLIGDGDLSAFLLYLAMECPAVSIMGRYPNLLLK